MHRDDPILIDAIAGCDGVFLNPIPAPIARILRRPEHPVVVLDEDFSRYGLPSIQFFPPAFAQRPLSCSFEAGSVETITPSGLLFPRAVQPRNRQQILRLRNAKDSLACRLAGTRLILQGIACRRGRNPRPGRYGVRPAVFVSFSSARQAFSKPENLERIASVKPQLKVQ